MRKLSKECCNVRKKAKLTRIVAAVVIMAICLAAMSYTAYAYYSYSIASRSNVITAAAFKTDVVINDNNDEVVATTTEDDYTTTAELAAGTYMVTVKRAGNAGTGFCVISAENCAVKEYYTQQFNEDVEAVNFELEVTNDTKVTFYAHWGTSSNYSEYKDNENCITNASVGSGKVVMTINNGWVSSLFSDKKLTQQ